MNRSAMANAIGHPPMDSPATSAFVDVMLDRPRRVHDDVFANLGVITRPDLDPFQTRCRVHFSTPTQDVSDHSLNTSNLIHFGIGVNI